MTLEEYRILFTATAMALILLATIPMLNMVIPLAAQEKPLTELWLLGPTHTATGYPFNVSERQEYSVFVGVRNQLGHLGYYRVAVQFRNQTHAQELSAVQFFVADGGTWESNVHFTLSNTSVHDGALVVGNVSLNGVTYPVNSRAPWDVEDPGFYYQIVFTLGQYNPTGAEFQTPMQDVALWLNVTAP